MAVVALLRHGITPWNLEGRIQGSRDEPLSDVGKAKLSGLFLPRPYDLWPAFVSPLRRTGETAALLGIAAKVEPRLREMNWGRYEGALLDELEAGGGDFAANAARGLDFRPPEGESPREVQSRALLFLAEVAGRNESAVAVTHKGVIRALLAAAHDWPMLGKAPVKLKWDCLQVFPLRADGWPMPGTYNIPLARQ